MSDSKLNYFVSAGTATARAAFTPSPPTPAAGPTPGYFWHETDTGDTYSWKAGTGWIKVNSGGGSGITALTGDVTASGTGSVAATIANDAVTYAKMQNVSATARILARKGVGAGDTEECTLSEILDFIGSAAQGDILYRGASSWSRLGAGIAGQVLKTKGASANPAWLGNDLLNGQSQWIQARYQDTTPDTTGNIVIFTRNLVSAAYATTNIATRRVRVNMSHNAANTVGEVRTNGLKGCVVGGTSQYRFRTRWSTVTTPSTIVLLAGVQGSWAPNGAVSDPSGATNILGVGFDAGDSNLQVMTNDGSGTATKTDLGSSFPARTVGCYYEARFEADGSGTVTYRVTRFDTGDVATGSITTDLPTEDGYKSGLVAGVVSAQSWSIDFHSWGHEQNHILGY